MVENALRIHDDYEDKKEGDCCREHGCGDNANETMVAFMNIYILHFSAFPTNTQFIERGVKNQDLFHLIEGGRQINQFLQLLAAYFYRIH